MTQHIENIGCKNMLVGPPEVSLAGQNNHISKGKGQTASFDSKGLFAASPSPSFACEPCPISSMKGYFKALALLEKPGRGPTKSGNTVKTLNKRFFQHKSPVVYFARSGQFIKIGKTKNLSARLTSMRTGCPTPMEVLLVLPGYTTLEQQMHSKFAAFRSHGEWFKVSDQLSSFIERSASSPSPHLWEVM